MPLGAEEPFDSILDKLRPPNRYLLDLQRNNRKDKDTCFVPTFLRMLEYDILRICLH